MLTDSRNEADIKPKLWIPLISPKSWAYDGPKITVRFSDLVALYLATRCSKSNKIPSHVNGGRESGGRSSATKRDAMMAAKDSVIKNEMPIVIKPFMC